MARTEKQGLGYFPFDIDFFQDLRIRKLIKYQGGKAITVYALLLCNIYKQGYYMRWDEELPFIVSEQTGFEEAYIREVIKCCLVIGLFSKELYESYKILTSKGIQERYQKINELCRRNGNILEFNIISSEEKPISSEEKPVYSEEKPISSAKSAQSKVNKNKKEKSTIVDKKKMSPSMSPEIKPLDDEIAEMKRSDVWLDSLQVVHRMDKDRLKAMLDKFQLHCVANGISCHMNIREAKQHFNNWLHKQQVSGKNTAGPGTSAIHIPTLSENLKEGKHKAEEEHKRILGIYEMAKRKPGSRYVQIVKEWAENGTLDRHGLKPLKN